jgi:catechol 2,3-dioxygenase
MTDVIEASRLPPSTRLGPVSLTVADLERSLAYYTERLGFAVSHREGAAARLSAGGDEVLVLVERPGARRVRGTTGLFHFAVLVPAREALALAFAHLAATRTPMQGAADHLVSGRLPRRSDGTESIIRDRPRDAWRWEGREVVMTEPLELEALLESRRDGNAWAGCPGTIRTHLHRRPQPAATYRDVIGFDLTARYGPAASFLSAGGYHHHVAVNTWLGVDAPPPPDDAVGLRDFVLLLPDAVEIERVVGRILAAGLPLTREGPEIVVRDPSGNALRLAPFQEAKASGQSPSTFWAPVERDGPKM